MRALRFIEPGRIEVQDLPDPKPREDEVLVRVLSTGVCGSDIHGYTGENGRRHPGQVMGHEMVGLLDPNGSGAQPTTVTVNPVFACGHCPACRRGQEQACPHRRVLGVNPEIVSAFAELIAVPERNVVPVDAALSPLTGALIEPLTVGYHALNRGGATPDDAVLVVGGGPIGQAAVLAAARLGIEHIVVSDPAASRRRLCERIGATTVDPSTTGLATFVSDTIGAPASLVIDAVGTDRSLASGIEASERGARVVLVGMNTPALSLDAYRISTDERSLIGSFCYSAREFADTAAWAALNTDRLQGLIDRVVDLDEAPAVFDALASGSLDVSKVLVRVGDPVAAAAGMAGGGAERQIAVGSSAARG